jgi:hypothetical protein
MDLKFSFGGASPDHHNDGHGEAPSGIPLPFSAAPASTSSVLEIHVRRTESGVTAEAVSGDGVTYGRAEIEAVVRDPEHLARTTQSAVARVVAELEGPLAGSVTAVVLQLDGSEQQVVNALAFEAAPDPALAVTSEAFQRRTGVASGTVVRAG